MDGMGLVDPQVKSWYSKLLSFGNIPQIQARTPAKPEAAQADFSVEAIQVS